MINNMKIVPVATADYTLKWTDEETTPKAGVPLAVKCDDIIYIVTDFKRSTHSCLVVAEAHNIKEVLLFSLKAYDKEPSNFDWSQIYLVAKQKGVNFNELAPQHMLKNYEESVNTLESMLKFPEVLSEYVRTKNIPWRTLILISIMPEKYEYIASYISTTTPSLQQFKNFIEQLRDFSDKICEDSYSSEDFSRLTKRTHPLHDELENSFSLIKKQFAKVGASIKYEEELGIVGVSISMTDYNSYKNFLTLLMESGNNIEDFFNKISKPLEL